MRVCVFCGSSFGARPVYAESARSLGRVLAERGIGLVYGGAQVGTMGELANAALQAGGEVVGIIPDHMVEQEIAHDGITELLVVGDMHERKAGMAARADAFIALPGGAGTMEELFEVWTWAQLGLHAKPLGLLDVAGYFAPLRGFLDHMVTEGFLRAEYRDMVLFEDDAGRLIDRIAEYEPPAAKWDTAKHGDQGTRAPRALRA